MKKVFQETPPLIISQHAPVYYATLTCTAEVNGKWRLANLPYDARYLAFHFMFVCHATTTTRKMTIKAHCKPFYSLRGRARQQQRVQ